MVMLSSLMMLAHDIILSFHSAKRHMRPALTKVPELSAQLTVMFF